jgi:hypothetical protein
LPAYGYQRAVIDPEYGLLELREVSFDLNAADLRRVAAFLMYYADRIEAGNWHSDHAHIDERDHEWHRDHPNLDVIVLHYRSALASP